MKAIKTDLHSGKLHSKPVPGTEITQDISSSGIENENIHSFPVIHIDFHGRILYANKAAFPLLGEWNCLANDFLPEEFIHRNPSLLNPVRDFELKCKAGTSVFYLDVIGFREAGYIGLYGFMTERKKEDHQAVNLFLVT